MGSAGFWEERQGGQPIMDHGTTHHASTFDPTQSMPRKNRKMEFQLDRKGIFLPLFSLDDRKEEKLLVQKDLHILSSRYIHTHLATNIDVIFDHLIIFIPDQLKRLLRLDRPLLHTSYNITKNNHAYQHRRKR